MIVSSKRLGGRVALGLHHDLLGLAEPSAVAVVDRLPERVGRRLGVLVRRQAHGLEQLVLKRDHLLIQAVGLHDGVGHLGLGQFFAEPLDHHDGLLGAGDDQVEVAVLQLLGGRERDELAVDAAQPDRPRSGPRNGTCASSSAAEAPIIDGTSGSFCRSAEIGPAWICTSSRYHSGKSGRIGRSISRDVRISLVVGRPSRLMKPPGNLPAA